MNMLKQEAAIEALLFAAGEPVSLSRLAACIGQDAKTTKKLVNRLIERYGSQNRGITVIELDEAYQMCTNPEFFEYVKQLVNVQPKKTLTPPLMETLAIVAYKQPVTKQQIEQIRGVNADHAVNKLLEYGLVAEKGRQDSPGRPILLGTSDEFLRHFGFSSLSRLPILDSDYERLRREAEEEWSLLGQAGKSAGE